MRKILKGIITSVFALSLILPVTVTTASAATANLSSASEISVLTPVSNVARVKADELGKAIKQKASLLLPGDTLEVNLGNLTIYGAILFKDGTTSDCIVPTGVKLIINGGKFVLTGDTTDQYGNPRAGAVTISKSDVTINGTSIMARDTVAIPAGGLNIAGIAIDASRGNTSKVNNTQINGVTIQCTTSLSYPNNALTGANYADGIVTFGIVGDLTINNCTINGYNSRCPLYFNSDGSSIDKVVLTNNTISGNYIYSPYFTSNIDDVNINGNKFYGLYSEPLKNKIAGLFSDANSDSFKVTNNYFDNCEYALGILSSSDSRKNLTFTGNSFNYDTITNTVIGIREFSTWNTNLSPVDQATHNYYQSADAKDGTFAEDYWFTKKTSTTPDSTSAPVYPYIPYYPTTTTTPATTVGDPFVYVYKDTPIGTTTPTTTDTTSRRDRSDRTTRSSRTANAVINASNKTIVAGSSFNFKEGVTATDNGGNGASLTNKVTITGSINTLKPGTYPITYKVTGANGVAVTKVATITVKAK